MLTSAKSPSEKSSLDTDNSEVPAKLINAAIRLYGDHGCHAVSARQIIKEAKVLNDAAIRYYFGKKEDLLRHCLQAIGAELRPIMQQAWSELDALKNASNSPFGDTRAVVTAMFAGLQQLYVNNPAAVKLLARVVREEGAAGQKMQMQALGDMVWRFEDELAVALAVTQPKKTRAAIRLHAVLCITFSLFGLVDQDLMSSLPASEAGREDYPLTNRELASGFIDFLVTGVAGPSGL
jgi:AcrR family transcriptional regulator